MDKFELLYKRQIEYSRASLFFILAPALVLFANFDKWLNTASSQWLSNQLIENGYIYIDFNAFLHYLFIGFIAGCVIYIFLCVSIFYKYKKIKS